MNSTLLKGVGILLIILHNYAHWLPQCVAENEYTFATDRIAQLGTYLSNGGPHLLLNILSHYGHYGVAIFLFLSGYGLVRKYEQQSTATRPDTLGAKLKWSLAFIWRHATKLWRLMLPALALFVVIELSLGTWNRPWSRLVPLIAFYSNLQPERDLILGPWWWFGLMMQFYLLWLLLIYKRGRMVLGAVMALCLATMLAAAWIESAQLNSEHTLTCWLHYNFPASMLAFGLGVAHARHDLSWLRQSWAPIVGALLVVAGSFNAMIWTIAPIGVIMCVVWMAQEPTRTATTTPNNTAIATATTLATATTPPNNTATATTTTSATATTTTPASHIPLWRRALIFIGRISAWMFALHPVVRAYAIKMARQDNDALLYLSVIIFVAVTISAAWAMTWTTGRINTILVKKHPLTHNKRPNN